MQARCKVAETTDSEDFMALPCLGWPQSLCANRPVEYVIHPAIATTTTTENRLHAIRLDRRWLPWFPPFNPGRSLAGAKLQHIHKNTHRWLTTASQCCPHPEATRSERSGWGGVVHDRRTQSASVATVLPVIGGDSHGAHHAGQAGDAQRGVHPVVGLDLPLLRRLRAQRCVPFEDPQAAAAAEALPRAGVGQRQALAHRSGEERALVGQLAELTLGQKADAGGQRRSTGAEDPGQG